MLSYRPRRWLVHLALAFGAGVFLGLRVSWTPLWAAGALICLGWMALLRRGGNSVYIPCMALAVLLGLARCLPAAHPALPPEGVFSITAIVQGETAVRETDNRRAVYLRDVTLEGAEGSFSAYWTFWPQDPEKPLLLDGQRVAFSGKVYHPMGQVNPHGFDFRMYLLQKGVTIGISGCDGLTLDPAEQTAPASLLVRARNAIRSRLHALLGAEHGALAAALILGDKSDLPEDVAESFRRTGTAHVLAVSGLHVMILFGCVLWALNRFSPAQWVVLAVAAVLLCAYGLLAGMQAAILRAALLMVYLQTGRILRRRRDRLTSLAAAFVVILLIRPLELFAAGFQMSFGAVLGLVLLGDRVNRALRQIRRPWLRRLLNAYGTALCASLGAALPVAWYYHRLSAVGVLISPLAVTLVTALLPLLLLALAVSLIWMAPALLLGRAAALLCGLLTGLTRLSASLPFASLPAPRLPWHMQAAIVLALLLCTRYIRLGRGKRLLIGGSALACSAAVMLLTRNTAVRYIQFSMGSADAAVLEDGSQTVVIDTGEYGGDLASYLLSQGRRADRVILSHLHADHALGLGELLRQGVPIGTVYISTEAQVTPAAQSVLEVLEQARAAGVEIRALRAGDRIALDRAAIDVLWPEENTANPQADANDFAMALWIDLDGFKMLQMSDVSGSYELRAARPAQALRVAHHGSASSTGEELLAAVQPQIALISTRRASDATLERLARAGVMVYDTNAGGALTLTVRDGQAALQCYLK